MICIIIWFWLLVDVCSCLGERGVTSVVVFGLVPAHVLEVDERDGVGEGGSACCIDANGQGRAEQCAIQLFADARVNIETLFRLSAA